MGVPKFFRYISERYPCLSESVKEHQLSEYDNMYLDMNGIVHTCSHPDDGNPHFRITEEAIFTQIFHYLSYLFQLIRPNKVFFMAIDGVAPRAKMNQQRGRRFRTAREAEEMEELARAKGEVLPTAKRFDTNCITPGTVFMEKLHEQLKYFVKHKISTDKAWSKCRIVLSGHETPGEGEHKIMDYIRYIKSQPDHDPNTRHCLYGLDADLIVLGLCTHEPNFSLLREEVKFGRNAQQSSTPDEKTFFLLHLSMMRSYLEQEFISLKNVISFGYDLEKIIDDWVLMSFLVGNDFIPPLPHLHIHTEALPLLYETYKKVIVKLDGYINEGGILNLARFEIFMKELSQMDSGFFKDSHASLRGYEGVNTRDNNKTFGVDALEIKNAGAKPLSAFQLDLKALIANTDVMTMQDPTDDMAEWEDVDDDSDDESNLLTDEFQLHRRNYYINKLKYNEFTPAVAVEQAECYVRAIQWILHYYYQGCVSWSWFYPHHYAPYITDVAKFKNMDLTYEMAYPFKPFEQLLAVLPAASKELLPDAFHFLMISDKSPIIHFYPEDFETDLNGKRNDWEAVVLIPFIIEEELLSAMKLCYEKLTDDEIKRNSHGPMFIYDYTIEDLGAIESPAYFPKLRENHAREIPLTWKDLVLPPDQVVRGPLPNALKHLYFPGIPTLQHIEFTSRFAKEKVRVFDQPSRSDNLILEITHDSYDEPAIEYLVSSLLGKVIWVGWPHLSQAKVVGVSNENCRCYYKPSHNDTSAIEDEVVTAVLKEDSKTAKAMFELNKKTILNHQMFRLGIDVGDITTIVDAVCLKGYKYVIGNGGNLVVEAIWCTVSGPYPLQTIIPKLETASASLNKRYRSLEDAMPQGDKVFITTGPYYGCMSEIVDTSAASKNERIRICVNVEPEPVITPLKRESNARIYMPANVAATRCGIPNAMLSRITGCLFVVPEGSSEKKMRGINLGLNLKYSKKNEEVTGYTHRVDNRWLYSQKCIDLIVDYSAAFPKMFQILTKIIDNFDDFNEKQLFPDNVGEGKIKTVAAWISAHPFNKYSIRSCDTNGLEPDELAWIRNSVDQQRSQLQSEAKQLRLQVKPSVLFKPELHSGNIPPDPSAAKYMLYDRVVNVNPNSTVPLGMKGTVTAIIQEQEKSNTVNLSDKLNSEPSYQVLFDEAFLGGISTDGIDECKFFRLLGVNLLNISHGRANYDKANKVQVNIRQPAKDNHPDNFNNLRANDGHNSAFASYASSTKHQPEFQMSNQYVKPPPHISIKQNANKGPQVNMPQVAVGNDPGTILLKSLLKINETNNRPQSERQNQESVSFVPNFSQPPPPLVDISQQPADSNYLQMVFPNNLINAQSTVNKGMHGSNRANLRQGAFDSVHVVNNPLRVTAPNNNQLPFPAKLIHLDAFPPTDNQRNKKTKENGTINPALPISFVPLQAVTKQRSRNIKPKKIFHEIKPATIPTSQNAPNITTKEVIPPSSNQAPTAPINLKKKKRSRIAANFGQL